MTTKELQNNKIAKRPKKLTGVVVSDKMKDTVTVLVNRFVKHPKYDKYINSNKKYKVHNPGNTVKVGEKVSIIECAPISKDKSFKII